jgi:hypothetical protein
VATTTKFYNNVCGCCPLPNTCCGTGSGVNRSFQLLGGGGCGFNVVVTLVYDATTGVYAGSGPLAGSTVRLRVYSDASTLTNSCVRFDMRIDNNCFSAVVGQELDGGTCPFNLSHTYTNVATQLGSSCTGCTSGTLLCLFAA